MDLILGQADHLVLDAFGAQQNVSPGILFGIPEFIGRQRGGNEMLHFPEHQADGFNSLVRPGGGIGAEHPRVGKG